MSPQPERPQALYYFLFFLSGISALLYQVVWTKELALLFGVTAYAVCTTLAIFMLGLALGSWYLGPRADTTNRPGYWYAVLELGIAATAGISIVSLEALDGLIGLIGFSSSTSTPFTLFRLAAALAVLIVPTFLMGGTLPFLARQCIRSNKGIAKKLGTLYSVNVLGAMFGCLLAGFFAIPYLGVRGTLLTGVLINVAVSLISFATMRSIQTATDAAATLPEVPEDASGTLEPPTALTERLMLGAFFMAGFLGLAAEVVWTRMLLLYLDATVQAFASVLAIYLLGLATGSLLSSKLAQRSNSLFSYGMAQLLTGLAIVVSFLAWTEWGDTCVPAVRAVLQSLPAALQTNTLFKLTFSITLTSILLFLPAVLMGIAFPFAARLFSRRIQLIGTRLGSAFMLNTLGAMIGPLVCGFFILPWLGMQSTLLLISLGYVACGTLLLSAGDMASKRWAVAGGGVLIVALSLFAFVPERVISSTYARRFGTVLYHEEDSSGSVAVVQSGNAGDASRQIIVGTTCMIGDNFRCRRYTRLIGHLPMLLHPAPRKALVICLGSGMTLSAIANHPDVERVDCADLSTGIIHAAKYYFKEANGGVLDDPRVKLVINDGRTHLLAVRSQYDVIALEPPPPNNASIANLYSQEFYELCRQRLAAGGMVAQWIPYHGATLPQIRSLVATMQAVFPHTTLWELFDGEEYCLIGHTSNAPVPLARIRDRLAVPSVNAHLRPVGIRSAEDIAACFTLGPKQALSFGDNAPAVTDDKPGLGYDSRAFDLFDINSPQTWDQIQRAAVATLSAAGDISDILSFSSDTEKTEFQTRLAPIRNALQNHNRAIQICTFVKAGTLADMRFDRDYIPPIDLDGGNLYYQNAQASGAYVMTLQQLALAFERKKEPLLAQHYARIANRLKGQLQNAKRN